MSGMSVQNIDEFEQALRRLVPLNVLPERLFGELLARASVLECRRGQYVFRQGDRDDFTFYLLEGELELYADGELVQRIISGTDRAVHALAQLQPRQLSARARGAARVLRVERPLLEALLARSDAPQAVEAGDVEIRDIESEDSGDWMTRMLQSALFTRVPAANIQQLFVRMEPIEAHAGDVIVQQGGPGDYYYIVQQGRAEVVRRTAATGKSIRLAELRPGDGFGEEALVSGSRRNASVTMLSDGELMRLGREDFVELIQRPLLRALTPAEAQADVAGGGRWLDVRFKDEFERDGPAAALNVPLNVMRLQCERLERDARYVVCCDDGKRSAVGAFLLVERGFDAAYLAGGLAALAGTGAARPEAANVVDFPPPLPAAGVGPARPFEAGDAPPAAAAQPGAGSQTTLEADVRAETLRAELARANVRLEEALRLKAEAEKARRAVEEQVAARVLEETDKARNAAEQRLAAQVAQEAEKARRAAEEQVAARVLEEADKARNAAEQRLAVQVAQETEKARRAAEEQVAARVAAESERTRRAAEQQVAEQSRAAAEQARRAAEEAAAAEIRGERERIEAEARRAQEMLRHAERMKAEIEAAKRAADEEVARRREAEEARIHRLQVESERRLEEERQRLEAMYRWKAEEIQRFQALKQEAEAQLRVERERLQAESEEARRRLAEARRIEHEVERTREAAAAEAQRRQQRQLELEQQLKAQMRSKIDAERRRLEAELARNAEQLELARREKAAAEAARAAAGEEAERIIAEYKVAHERMREAEEAQLAEERARLEREATEIREQLEAARRAKTEAETARTDALRHLAERELAAKAGAAVPSSAAERAELTRSIEAIEAEMSHAAAEFEAARAAQVANAAELRRNHAAEDNLHQRLEQEVAQWLRDQDELLNSDEQREILASQQAYMERIKKRAEQARQRAKQHDQSLLDEIAARLRDPDPD